MRERRGHVGQEAAEASYGRRVSEEVLVVVVAYNSSHVIDMLLDSLPAAFDGIAHEVVVVDNASSDGTAEQVRRRGDCTVVEAPNLGYSAGINRGVAEMVGDGPIYVLNPDVRLAAGSVRPMLEALQDPRIGIAVPRVTDEHGRLSRSMRREPTLPRALGLGRTRRPLLSDSVDDPAAYDHAQACDWALGAVMLVSRECYEKLDGWDESYFLYAEETDFCLRARDQGWLTWYVPEASAMHIGGQSGQNAKTGAMLALNRVRLYGRRHGHLATSLYFAASVVAELSRIPRRYPLAKAAARALLVPAARPRELGLSDGFLPR